MSDNNPNGQAASAPDVKAEINELKSKMEATQKELLAAVAALKKPAPAPVEAEEDLETQLYSNPKAALARVMEQTKKETLAEVARASAYQQRVGNTIASLQNEYPELADTSSELAKKAIANFNALSDEDKQSPMAYKLAVREAADEIGLKPKSKRPVVEDSWESGDGYTRSSRRPASNKLDPASKEWAELLGLEVTEDVEKRLIERSKRDFKKFQPPVDVRRGKK
jgi:hypothetical protein